MVGDPSGRTTAREKIASSIRDSNRTSISQQLQTLLVNVDDTWNRVGCSVDGAGQAAVIDNLTWFENTSALEILSTLAAGMPISPMLGRDS